MAPSRSAHATCLRVRRGAATRSDGWVGDDHTFAYMYVM